MIGFDSYYTYQYISPAIAWVDKSSVLRIEHVLLELRYCIKPANRVTCAANTLSLKVQGDWALSNILTLPRPVCLVIAISMELSMHACACSCCAGLCSHVVTSGVAPPGWWAELYEGGGARDWGGVGGAATPPPHRRLAKSFSVSTAQTNRKTTFHHMNIVLKFSTQL